ncbi:nucleotidyltransferase family protein [Petrachloros mirabilis]
MTTVSAILLAAGESRRMAGTNKLTLPVNGEPLLRRVAKTLLGSRLQEVVVVLGHQAEDMKTLLKGLDIKQVYNEAYGEGQMSSVHRGLEGLSAACDGVMVCLSDQPLLTSNDIDSLIDAFGSRTRGSILVPTYRGQRGNPIILAFEHRASILSGGRNLGCKRLIERNPDLVTTVEMDSEHVVVDLDTPEDYAGLRQHVEPECINPAVS